MSPANSTLDLPAWWRATFDEVLLELRADAASAGIRAPECFISYAWGDPDHEQWVSAQLATDLDAAGIRVVLDQWANCWIGMSVTRFIGRVSTCDFVVVVGTPLYRRKYDNDEPMGGYVVAAEGDLIGERMIGSEARKQTVLPVLRAGDRETAFPDLLRGRVLADVRAPDAYPLAIFDLVLSLYRIERRSPAVAQLRRTVGDALAVHTLAAGGLAATAPAVRPGTP
jgi:hypothetical protein